MNQQLTEALDAWSASDTKARRIARAAIVNKRHAALDSTREAWRTADILARRAKLAHTLDGAPADPAAVEVERDAWSKYKNAQEIGIRLKAVYNLRLTSGPTGFIVADFGTSKSARVRALHADLGA